MEDYLKMKLSPNKQALTNELKIANSIRGKNKFKVLDICCRRFPRGYGVDIHPGSNADLLCDAHNLKPLADKSFDLTLCVEGIEHLRNPAQAVTEWARVTRYALMVTTPNAHCWRRWFKLPWSPNPVSSNFHYYLWDQYTYRNFWRNLFPHAPVKIEWYDRYPKKTMSFWPPQFFRENISAFIWLSDYKPETSALYLKVYGEAKRLIESRPERHPLYNSREYNCARLPSHKLKGVDQK
jgi:SAM-dependent methyltransferase